MRVLCYLQSWHQEWETSRHRNLSHWCLIYRRQSDWSVRWPMEEGYFRAEVTLNRSEQTSEKQNMIVLCLVWGVQRRRSCEVACWTNTNRDDSDAITRQCVNQIARAPGYLTLHDLSAFRCSPISLGLTTAASLLTLAIHAMPHCPRCGRSYLTDEKVLRHLNQPRSSCVNLDTSDLISITLPLNTPQSQNVAPEQGPDNVDTNGVDVWLQITRTCSTV